jgi:hypothetical protein
LAVLGTNSRLRKNFSFGLNMGAMGCVELGKHDVSIGQARTDTYRAEIGSDAVMISDAAMGGARPTEAQKRWLAGVFGSEVWEELCGRADFRAALETSVDLARRVGLRYLAEKEVYRRTYSID